jgi:replicative DNA helicase
MSLLREPPYSYEAEQAVLGAILMNNRTYDRVSEFLRPEHFSNEAHSRIYEISARLIDGGKIATPVTLSQFLDDDPFSADVGGAAYIAQLANSCVSVVNATEYARLVYDLHMKRALIDIGTNLVNQAYAKDTDAMGADKLLEATEAHLFELSASGTVDGDLREFGVFADDALKAWESAYQRKGEPSGIPTGLVDLDKCLGGLNRSDLLILAGRPAMGKTSMATSMLVNAARQGAKVAFFSLEMSGGQLAQRIISAHAGVDGGRARKGEIDEREFERLTLAAQELRQLGVYIDDTAAVTVQAIRNRARRMKRKKGLDVIAVDYIGLATPTTGVGSRVHEIEGITKGLKALAKELDVPVIALSQLSRAVETREDKRPQLSDLRDSGSIEQDADCVMFVYREQYYLERAEPARRPEESDQKFNDRYAAWESRLRDVTGIAEAIIAKNRHGPSGSVRLAFDGPTTRFSNLAYQGGDQWPA